MNPIMLDGTGMCGACRVSEGEKTKFACVDGPFLDGLQIDWIELMQRQAAFKIEEIEGQYANINFGGVKRKIGLHLVPEAGIGDYVLLHAGFAIKKIDEEEAKETLSLLEEIFSEIPE